MSYSGYYEYITKSGRYFTQNVYDDDLPDFVADDPIAFSHSVDQTNGYDESEPYSCNAPKKVIGFIDKWRKDHYGTVYADKEDIYEPSDLKIWREI